MKIPILTSALKEEVKASDCIKQKDKYAHQVELL